ncbi:uncharacterized protein LOC117821998 isoform X1 [Notolabrus celidotus]|uniref:uncharacterized protein LOC117821998 isoform X1 n=1 Tax=Notolabrus celidotus TaxID=1203425 RepID=UPI00148F6EBC|nr:uncharacterized protein LOC117821998 isoform X1 [Notolabrus celidotus]
MGVSVERSRDRSWTDDRDDDLSSALVGQKRRQGTILEYTPSGASLSSSSSSASDDTIILNFTMCDPPEEAATAEGSQPKRPCHINYEAKALIEKVLTTKPGGGLIMQEYARTKSLEDATRRQMINILAAEMTETHGTSPPKSVRVTYAQGIVALFPYLEDPYSQHGYEHYYDPESGSGYLAWRLKTIQRKSAEERGNSLSKSPKIGGPGPSPLTQCSQMRMWKQLLLF